MDEHNIELLSIGDITWDVFLTPTESEAMCSLNDKDCYICFTYGDKIPVKTLEYSLGGNAANNSVGASRLGIKTALVTTLGAEPTGDMICRKIESEGVDMTFVVQQPNTGSNYSTVVRYGGERTIFTYHAPRSYEFPVKLPSSPWVYLTSMGETFQPFYNHFVEWKKERSDVKVAFNPGSRQLRAGIDVIKPVMELSHIIYVNRSEAEMLTGMENTPGKEKDLLKNLSAMGPKISIITDGGNGAYVYDGESFYKSDVMPVDAYERTGAGDSFGAGCIAGLIKGKSFEEALLWGTVNSASVIGYVGAQRGLLREEELPEWIDRAKSSGVEVKKI